MNASELSYEFIHDNCVQVFMDDYYVGDLIKANEPSEPDSQGRMFVGPWMFDGSQGTILIGWPAIRNLTLEIERLNTHWNWTLQNAARSTEGIV